MTKNFHTVIEIHDTGFSILQAKGAKPADAVVTFFVSEKLPQTADDPQIPHGIFAKLNKSGRKGLIYLVLPRRLFLVKNFVLPSQEESVIKKMISLQLPSHIPYREEDVLWDHRVLEKTADGNSRVLFLAVSREALQSYQRMFSDNGISPSVITLSSWGLAGWRRLVNNSSEVSLTLRVEDSFSEICFCDQEQFYFSRQWTLGSRDLENATAPAFIKEIALTLEAYSKEKMGPVPASGIILCSGSAGLFLKREIQKKYGFPINLCDSFPEKTPGSFEKSLTDLDPALFPALAVKGPSSARPLVRGRWPIATPRTSTARGASPRHGLKPVASDAVCRGVLAVDAKSLNNFLPQAPIGTRWLRKCKTALGIVILLGAVLSALMAPVYKKSYELAIIQRKIKEFSPPLKDIRDRIRRWESLKNERSGRIPVVELLDEIYRLTPEEIFYNSLRFQGRGELSLQGQSLSGPAVNQLQGHLVNSPWFKNVTLEYSSKRATVAGEATLFLITAKIRKP